ncbi:MAG TPA: type IV conjugative transfer system coupling protein TraD [Woeseiaceae bacterium]|nr:type IV conjugative transfer system coupling protein TraD [Woeseiaceae bacterium]
MPHPIEALLRPPIELYTAAVALAGVVVCIAVPDTLLLPAAVAQGLAAALAVLSICRAYQGFTILRYQYRLRRTPSYRLPNTELPVSDQRLFLGRGFRWSQRHAQRLRDALRPSADRYRRRPALSRLLKRSPPNEGGGLPALHGVALKDQAVWMNLADRVGHTLVLGTTRVGKTRLAELMIAQDIHRGEVVIVFDPKGDADLMRRVYVEARRAGRADQFYLFHLGYPAVSARYNAIGNFSRITEVASRIANQLPREGNSAAFREFAWRFVNIIARALVALGRRPDYTQVRRYINDIEPLYTEYAEAVLARQGDEHWQAAVAKKQSAIKEGSLPPAFRGRAHRTVALYRYLQEHPIDDGVLEGLISAIKYDRSYFDKIVSSVGPLMEKLTTGTVAALIAPDYFDANDERPIFEWLDVVQAGGIVYVGLDALTDATVAAAVGNSMFADLVSVAGHLYKQQNWGEGSPPTISLHADEFNELCGDEFIPLLNKAGGAGFQVTAYTQTWSDVEARFGSRAKAGQVAGNFNTLIMMRVKDLVTARLLTDQLRSVEVLSLMNVSGVDDSSNPETRVDFTSKNEDRISVVEVPMVTPAELVRLPKGHAFALLHGGELWKLRLPLPVESQAASVPATLKAIAQTMRRSYISNPAWYRELESD